jgi:hypothetical protein
LCDKDEHHILRVLVTRIPATINVDMQISLVSVLLIAAGLHLSNEPMLPVHGWAGPVEAHVPVRATATAGERPAWSKAELARADAARGVSYLTADERSVVRYVNLARMYPRKFAIIYLHPLRSRYNGDLLELSGRIPIRTQEGVAALEECIDALEEQPPCKALLPARGLSRAASDHVADCGPTGMVGHTGADGSTLGDRIGRHGTWSIRAGENIAFGEGSPLFIVIQLLVDDGTSSRGHRHNIFNCSFGRIGVSIGPHAKWSTMCVMDFTGGFQESKGDD